MDNLSFFDSIAENWDQIAIHDEAKVAYIIENAGIERDDQIIDLGSGTGILIPFIKKYIGSNGKIVAIDISSKMIEIAKRKNGTDNIEYVCDDFLMYESNEKRSVIIAYSCFPHFSDHDSFFKKCSEILKETGRLIIAHSESKEKINGDHRNIEDSLKSLVLISASDVSKEAMKYGFREKKLIDNDEYYLIILEK